MIFLSLAFVKAERTRFVRILGVNDGNPVTPGQSVPVEIKFVHSTTDTAFDLIFRDDEGTIFEKLLTVEHKNYQFNKDNQYNVGNITIPNVPEGNYKIYGYIDSEKVSDSYTVILNSGGSNPVSNETIDKSSPEMTTTATSTPTDTTNLGVTNNNTTNVSTAPNQPNQKDNKSDNNLNWKNILIIVGIASGVVIIFVLLCCCCCMRSSRKKKREAKTNNLTPSVSAPQLVSSSSPINAIPLYNNNNNTSNVNMNSRQQFTSPIVSPIINSISNYSDEIYNQDTQDTQDLKSRLIQIRDEAKQLADTISSNNSGFISQGSITTPDDDMSSPSPSYYFQVFKPHQVYRVLYDFVPSLPDEMEIQAGDIIRTEETFEDGWAYGINMTSGKRGTFPMNCLEDDFATEGDSKSIMSERSHSRRTSSLPNNPNAQAIQMMLNNSNSSQSFQKSYYMS